MLFQRFKIEILVTFVEKKIRF